MFVGGEFYEDDRWKADQAALSTQGMLFLNGGQACLTLIGAALLDQGIRQILLPAYLCPSILDPLERCGISYDFYRVNPDFSIDLEDIKQKLGGERAVYLINYFGFLHPPRVREFFLELRRSGITVVEDNAQAGFTTQNTGDFVFNSLRKLVPYDGGYLIAQRDLSGYLSRYQGRPNRRLPVIRAYRRKLYPYLMDGVGSYAELDALYQQAEQYYAEDRAVLGDEQERRSIEHLDWPGIRQARRENYQYLLSLIVGVPGITPIFPALQADNLPLGLPVYFSSGQLRDQVYESLGRAGVGLCIHWDELCQDPRTNRDRQAVDMASRILTLVIDQRASHKQLDYQAVQLMEALRSAGSALQHIQP